METMIIFVAVVAMMFVVVYVMHSEYKENEQIKQKIADCKVGDKFLIELRYGDNPFFYERLEMEITEIKQGWARYKFQDGFMGCAPIRQIVCSYKKEEGTNHQRKTENGRAS